MLCVLVGFRLVEINECLVLYGFWFFVDLSVDFLIGGMVVYNIGGMCMFCYGDVWVNILVLEVVLLELVG